MPARRESALPRHLSLVPTVPGLKSPLPPPRGQAPPPRRAAAAGEPTVRVRLAAVTERCWQCRTKVRAVVGVLLEGRAFVPFDEVADELAAALDPRALAARRIGPIAHRDSPGVEGGYVSNGCVECDALLGRFALEDLLREHLAGGGTYGQLDIGIPVELPAVAPLRRAAHA
jgi:hypothetical protein